MPKVIESKNGKPTWVADDAETLVERMHDACGTNSHTFALTLSASMANAAATAYGSVDKAWQGGLDFINGIAPKDELEAALAAQMFAVHTATMSMAARAGDQKNLEAIKVTYDQFNKLSRTFAAQVEALAKLRNGGKQTVEVKYIDARNSQNVIAETVVTGGGLPENPMQPCEPAHGIEGGTIASVVPLRSKKPARQTM